MKNRALTAWLISPEGLASRLKALRVGAGLSGDELAASAGPGWTKTKVSKIERGRQLPSPADLDQWAVATRADADELLALLNEAHTVHVSWSGRLAAGQAGNQAVYLQLARDSKHVWALEQILIPGLLQTPAYAAAVLADSIQFHGGEKDLADAVAARMERQAVLYETGREFEFILSEGCLRTQLMPPEDMAVQIQRIQTLADLDHVRLGIIPQHRPLVAFPRQSFAAYDDQLVLVELPSGESAFDRPHELKTYRRVFDQAWNDAVEGDEAAEILAEIGRRYRSSS